MHCFKSKFKTRCYINSSTHN